MKLTSSNLFLKQRVLLFENLPKLLRGGRGGSTVVGATVVVTAAVVAAVAYVKPVP